MEELRDPKTGGYFFSKRTTSDLQAYYKQTGTLGDTTLYAKCKGKYYRRKVIKNIDKNNSRWKLDQYINCFWEKPGFERTLEQSGYYERVRNGYPNLMLDEFGK